MQVDMDAGTLKLWLYGKPHGPSFGSGVTGPLRWATSVYSTGRTHFTGCRDRAHAGASVITTDSKESARDRISTSVELSRKDTTEQHFIAEKAIAREGNQEEQAKELLKATYLLVQCLLMPCIVMSEAEEQLLANAASERNSLAIGLQPAICMFSGIFCPLQRLR